MALFKIYRGSEENLPSAMNDGWAYFCTNSGNFYIDWADINGGLTRVQINAGAAEKLRYVDSGEYVEIDAATIAEAIAKAHGHSNIGILNEINADSISQWNGKSTVFICDLQPAQLKENDLWIEVVGLTTGSQT